MASTETAAAMMKGNAGKRLINSIERAIKFRKEIKRLKVESDGWFFDVWQPEHIDEPECWPLRSDSARHGFKNIDNEHMYLDPIKVTILTPGMSKEGEMQPFGIPASIVAKYLDERGIIVEKPGRTTCCSCSASASTNQGAQPAARDDRLQTLVRSEPAGEKHAAFAVSGSA